MMAFGKYVALCAALIHFASAESGSGSTCGLDASCSCCCHGSDFVATSGGMGLTCFDGTSTMQCCDNNVNSISITVNGDVEALAAAGDIDGNILSGEVIDFLVGTVGVPLEDILDVKLEGSEIIVVLSNDNDPDTVESFQAAVNVAIGLFTPTEGSLVASAGSTSLQSISTGVDAQGKQITLITFCSSDSGKSGKSKKGKSDKKGKKSGKKMPYRQRRKKGKNDDEDDTFEARDASGDAEARGTSGDSFEARGASGDAEARGASGDEALREGDMDAKKGKKGKKGDEDEDESEGRQSSGDVDFEGRGGSGARLDCVPPPAYREEDDGKKGKKDKKGKGKSAAARMQTSKSHVTRTIAGAMIGIGGFVLAVAGVSKLMARNTVSSHNEATESSPLLTEV